MLDSGKIASVLGLLETMSGRQVAKRLRISRGVVQSIANGTYPSIGEGKEGRAFLVYTAVWRGTGSSRNAA